MIGPCHDFGRLHTTTITTIIRIVMDHEYQVSDMTIEHLAQGQSCYKVCRRIILENEWVLCWTQNATLACFVSLLTVSIHQPPNFQIRLLLNVLRKVLISHSRCSNGKTANLYSTKSSSSKMGGVQNRKSRSQGVSTRNDVGNCGIQQQGLLDLGIEFLYQIRVLKE